MLPRIQASIAKQAGNQFSSIAFPACAKNWWLNVVWQRFKLPSRLKCVWRSEGRADRNNQEKDIGRAYVF
ncbi:MAG: hypothetical protein ACI8QU_000295 [Devosia litorisediminis]|jgi:hypothetical protein